jgi:hypothetical protein
VPEADVTLQHLKLKDVKTLFDDWSEARRADTIVLNFCDGQLLVVRFACVRAVGDTSKDVF